MTDVMNITKKAFTWSVVVMTIAWSMGLAALAPLAANAATCSTVTAGDVIQSAGSNAVWVVTSDLKRMAFPNSHVYHTWYPDFSGLQVLSVECYSNIPAASQMVKYRPGSFPVRFDGNNHVYVVGENGMLHWVKDGAFLKTLYGENSLKPIGQAGGQLVGILPVFESSYTVGADLDTLRLHNGMLVKVAGSSDVWSVMGDKLHKVTGTLPAFVAVDVRTVSQALVDAVEVGADVTAASITADPTQGAVSGSTPGETVPVGNVSASLAADTPAAMTLSNSTVYNPVLRVRLSAGSEGATVKSITVRKTGLITNTNVSGITLWVDGYRKGDVMSSFNTDNKVTVGFASDPIVIPANGSKTVTVAMNFSATATGGTVGAEIAAATDIDSTASVSGSFPISGATFGLTDGDDSLASVTVSSQSVGGQTTEPVTADAGQMEIGETKEIAKFKFTEAGTNEARIEQLTFYIEGSIQDSDLKNFELYAPDNTLLGSSASMYDRYVTIKLTNAYEVPKGTNRTFTLRATAMDGASRWFRVQLQSEYDLMIKDADTPFYILPTDGDSTWNAVSSTSGYFKLKAGTLTVVKRSDSASGQIAAGATDISLGSFDVKAVGEDVEVRKIGLQIATSSVSTRLTGNVKVVVDGTTVLTTSAADNSLYAGTQYNLSSYVTIESGKTKTFEVIGSIDSNAVATSEYTAKVGKAYLKRLSTKDFQDNKPSSTLTAANTLSMSSNSFTIAKDTALGNKNIAPGAEQIIGQWVVKAPSAQGAKVSAVSFTMAGANGVEPSDFQNVTLWSGSTQLGTVQSTGSTSSFSYTFSGLELAKNATAKLTLKGVLNSSATTGSTVTMTATLSSLTWTGLTTQNSTDDTTGYAGQTNTIRTATVTVSAASDSTTISAVRLPSSVETQLGKWKVQVNNDTATFDKIRLYVYDETNAVDTASGNFASLNLYDSADMSKPLNSSPQAYVAGSGNGYVEFSGLNWSVSGDTIKYLVLKGKVNESGTMNANSYNYFAVPATSTTNYTVKSNGSDITTTGVTVSSPSSTVYLFHNAAPTISKFSVGSSLALSTQAKIFGFTVSNPGDRELRLATSTVSVAVSGLTSASSNTGTIGTFKLWEANASGDPATELAAASTTVYCLAGGAGVTNCNNSNTGDVPFGEFNDVNSLLDNLTVPAGSSRTFIVTADTTDILDGKSTGSVSVSVTMNGATGFVSGGGQNQETSWADGVLLYYYTPVGSSSESGPFSASDSYDVVGDTLTRSL